MKKGFIIISTLISMCSIILSEIIFELGTIDSNNGTIEVLINTDSDFMGFQLDVNGVDLIGGSGGIASDNNFDVYASGNTALGFSLDGNVIPAGSIGVLTILEGSITNTNDQVCLPLVQNTGPEDDTPILSDTDGNAISNIMVGTGNCDALSNNDAVTFSLLRTYPNPFNPELNIDVAIEQSGQLDVSVYNLNGQLIHNLYNNMAISNNIYRLKWNASSNISSGIYVIKVSAPDAQYSSIVNLLK
jgi:hypothetical protein